MKSQEMMCSTEDRIQAFIHEDNIKSQVDGRSKAVSNATSTRGTRQRRTTDDRIISIHIE